MAEVDPFTNEVIGTERTPTPKLPAIKYGGGDVDPFTNEPLEPKSPFDITQAERGEKIAKAEYEAIAGPLVGAYDILTGKKKDLPVGQKIKGVLTAPLYTVSGAVGAPFTAALAGTGLDEAFGKAFQKYVPEEAQEPAAAALEVAGALSMKGGKLLPVKGKTVQLKNLAKGIKEGQNLSAVKLAEEEIIPAITKYKDGIQNEVYAPMREALKNVKTRGFVGKIAAKEINAYADSLKAAGSLSGPEEKMLRGIANDLKEWNTLDTLLNRRIVIDRQLGTLIPAGSTDAQLMGFVSKLKGDTRKIITKTIRDFIEKESPAVLKQFDDANLKYFELSQTLDELESAVKKDPTKFFESGIVNPGIRTSRAAVEAAGKPLIAKGAYKYLSDEVMENGIFRTSKFKKFMDKIPDEVGAEIFGSDWAELQQLEKIVSSKYNKPVGRLARKMGGIPNAAVDLLTDATLKGLIEGKALPLGGIQFAPEFLQSTVPAQTRQLAEETRK